MKRIAIVTTHPIQYYAPLFALMAKQPELEIMVYYTWGESCLGEKYDADFGKSFEWDIPLLKGYNFTFVKNISKDPGTHHFKGIINPTLHEEIAKWSPDIVWVWGWAWNSHLKAMRCFKGKIPVWFRGDSTLLDEPKGFSLKKIARRIFLSWVYKHVDKAFYVGTHNKAYFKAHGLRESQLVYAPHAIDNERFADLTDYFTEQAQILKSELGIRADQKVLLFVGKFETKKDPIFFKQLISELDSQKYIGIMVGHGILEDELKKDAPNNLFFLPFQNQSKMPIIYRLANALILPSSGPGETWGLVMNEALACKIEVFASDKCGGAYDLLPSNHVITQKDKINHQRLLNEIENLKSNSKQIEIFNSSFNFSRIVESILISS